MSKNASRGMLMLFPFLVGFACPATAAREARVSETYAKVRYADLYPRIDLLYYGNQRQLEYDLVVRPGADPTRIVLDIQGADRLQVDAQGDLVLQTTVGPIRQRKPVIYQEVDGVRKDIPGGYVLKGEHQVGYKVAAY